MPWDELREQMVQQQLFTRGILDDRILQSFRLTPRHLFIPEPLQSRAYEDRALPVGFDQTVSQPYMVALMLRALALRGAEKILEIGTGSGYEAALLSHLCREVYTVEIIPKLAARARGILQAYPNIHVLEGDGSGGWPAEAPYDAILVAAATPKLPEPLVDQLKTPGRLVLPLGKGTREVLTLVEKTAAGVTRKTLGECAFVPLRGRYGLSVQRPV